MRKELSVFLVVVFFSGVVLAQVPSTLNFQGQLLQKEIWGTGDDEWMLWPVRLATVDATFRLYTSATGSGAVWFENYSVTTTYEGIYNVQLGSQTPFSLEARSYWLGITVNDNDEMSPRLPMGSALSALFVQGLTLDQGRYLDLLPHSAAPELCTSANSGAVALNSNYAPCICNGDSWRFVGYGTACQW